VTSLFTHGCIEEGKDITDGCLKYTERAINFAGLANAADSLYTIKKLIFEERKFNFSEMNKMLNSNWLGYERIRDLILELPKFGNDVDEVDELAVYIQNEIEKILSKYRNFRGKRYIPSLFSWMCHAVAGTIIGPTPDGRKKEEPMAQGPNSQHGRARSGFTSLIHSLTKLDYKKVIGGPWQFECEPSLLGDETSKVKNLQALIESYFERDGIQVNVNIVSLQDLIKAMEDPDSYQHLVVRVTAQPALFIKLDKKIQEEIVARMRGFYVQ
jgi:formate C-acetyltransferase